MSLPFWRARHLFANCTGAIIASWNLISQKKTDIKLRQKQIMSKPITCHAKLLAKRESPYKRVKRIENKWRTAFCCAWLARILNLLEEWCCNFTLACSIYARWPTCGCTEKKLYFISGNESSKWNSRISNELSCFRLSKQQI